MTPVPDLFSEASAQPVLPPPPDLPRMPSFSDPLPPLSSSESQAVIEEFRLTTHPLYRKLLARQITPNTVLPKRQFLFTLFGKPCFAKGELVAVTGKAKSGKTFLCSSLITSALCGDCLGLHRQTTTPLRVLWIDTEQSEESTQEILVQRIQLQVSTPQPALPVVYNLRAISWDQRMAYIEAAMHIHLPELVIFDGIRDVVADINDGVRAQQVVERLMQLASDSQSPSCIVCVLHQNKAVEDSTLRGALGTELTNKCFETYECRKQDGIFSIQQTATRKYDIHGKLFFSITDTGLPVLTSSADDGVSRTPNPYIYYKDGRARADCNRLLQDCLVGGARPTRSQLIQLFADRLGPDSYSWAERLVDSIIQRGGLHNP